MSDMMTFKVFKRLPQIRAFQRTSNHDRTTGHSSFIDKNFDPPHLMLVLDHASLCDIKMIFSLFNSGCYPSSSKKIFWQIIFWRYVLVKGNLQNAVSSGEQRLPQLSVSAPLHVCGSAGSFDRTFAVLSAGPFEAFDSMPQREETQ